MSESLNILKTRVKMNAANNSSSQSTSSTSSSSPVAAAAAAAVAVSQSSSAGTGDSSSVPPPAAGPSVAPPGRRPRRRRAPLEPLLIEALRPAGRRGLVLFQICDQISRMCRDYSNQNDPTDKWPRNIRHLLSIRSYFVRTGEMYRDGLGGYWRFDEQRYADDKNDVTYEQCGRRRQQSHQMQQQTTRMSGTGSTDDFNRCYPALASTMMSEQLLPPHPPPRYQLQQPQYYQIPANAFNNQQQVILSHLLLSIKRLSFAFVVGFRIVKLFELEITQTIIINYRKLCEITD